MESKKRIYLTSIFILFISGSILFSFLLFYLNKNNLERRIFFSFLVFFILGTVSIFFYFFKFYRLTYIETVSKKINIDRDNVFTFTESGNIFIDKDNIVMDVSGIIEDRYSHSWIGRNIFSISPAFKEAMDFANTSKFSNIDGSDYEISYSPLNKSFLIKDVSKLKSIIDYSNSNRLVIGVIYIDKTNLNINSNEITMQEAINNVRTIIFKWVQENKIFIQKISEESYMVIFNYNDLQKMKENSFDLLKKVKRANDIQGKITLSLGVSHGDTNLSGLYEIANDCVKLAISRGGDQVVLKEYGQPAVFYGAETESKNYSWSSEVRFFTLEVISNINKFSNVVIMGHKFSDYDYLGSAIAISKIAQSKGVNCRIVVNIETMEEKSKESFYQLDKKANKPFLSSTKIEEWLESNPDTLLIVADCSDRIWLENPNIIDKVPKIIVIDHHRIKEIAINTPTKLVDPSASSTVEITTQMLQFAGIIQSDFSKLELDIMIAGVMTDSNNLRLRTTKRTISTLHYLEESGGSVTDTLDMLKDSYDIFRQRNVIFSNSFEIFPGIVVAKAPEDLITESAFLAKISDFVLRHKGVKACFTVGKVKNNVIYVSARSNNFNVMKIAEELGGGGHFSAAAAQFTDYTINEVIDRIKISIGRNSNESYID